MASVAFLKIPDVNGEATDAEHKGWIPITSLTFEVSRPAGGVVSDFTAEVTKVSDPSSHQLIVCCGKPFDKVQLRVARTVQSGARPYIEFELEDVVITEFVLGAKGSASGMGDVTETIKMMFRKVTETFKAFAAAGAGAPRTTVGSITRGRQRDSG